MTFTDLKNNKQQKLCPFLFKTVSVFRNSIILIREKQQFHGKEFFKVRPYLKLKICPLSLKKCFLKNQ